MADTAKTTEWNGYLDWAATLVRATFDTEEDKPNIARLFRQGFSVPETASREDLWEPIFVQAKSQRMTVESFFEGVGKDPNLAFDPFEQTLNSVLDGNGPVEAFLYQRRRGTPADFVADNCDVQMTGAIVTADGFTPVDRVWLGPGSPGLSTPPVLGIIDDSIGVLHHRFRSGPKETRVRAFWAQALAKIKETDGTVRGGARPEEKDIEDLLVQSGNATEAEMYSTLLEGNYTYGTRLGLQKSASHGTFMLDLAGGADFDSGDAMSGVPIVAAQLPPQSFDDTSGVRLQTHLLQALRWIIYEARRSEANLVRHLVVNISLGVVAGAKTGTTFVESQIRREIERAAKQSPETLVQVVLPYGNSYNDRLVARFRSLARGDVANLEVRLQPSDATPSFVELRVPGATGTAGPMLVSLTGPDGTKYLTDEDIPAGWHTTIRDRTGSPMARVYHSVRKDSGGGEIEPPYLLVAFAPTVALSPRDFTCPHGGWKVDVRNVDDEALDLVAQIQRDDALEGAVPAGRQAYFDAECAHAWDPDHRDFDGLPAGCHDGLPAGCHDGLPAGCHIVHEGTNSAYSTIPNPNPSDNAIGIWTAGGALVRKRDFDGQCSPEIEPAEYASQGADWSGGKPSAGALSETDPALPGVMAAGTFSHETARFSGSSAAAATICRDLILQANHQNRLPSEDVLPGTHDETRLGERVVTANPAIRSRRP